MIKKLILSVAIMLPAMVLADGPNPITNLSNQCSCFATSQMHFQMNISHCVKTAAPMLIGVYLDSIGDQVRILQPGERITAPIIVDAPINPRTAVAGVRLPGPRNMISGDSAFMTQLPAYPREIYAVPVYLPWDDGSLYIALQVVGLTARELDADTCTYHPRVRAVLRGNRYETDG